MGKAFGKRSMRQKAVGNQDMRREARMILHGKGKGTCGGDWRDLGRKTHHLITVRREEYNVLHVSLYHEH